MTKLVTQVTVPNLTLFRKLSKWRASPPPERHLFLEAWLLLAVAGSALRFLPLHRVQVLLQRICPSSGPPLAEGGPERLARLVDAAARRHFWTARCLERSLVLQALLTRGDLRPDLRIGVHRDGESLRAHAWIEVAGRPVGEAQGIAGRFLPFPGVVRE